MAMDWFRSWHNAPTDPKWLLIARKANVPPGMVSAIFWALLDHASQEKQRGSIAGFDVETYAGWAGWDEDAVQAVIGAMRSKGVITPDNRLSSWEKRQVKREDEGGTERVRAWRDAQRNTDVTQNESVINDVTQGNTKLRDETTDKIREDTKKRRKEENPESAQAPSASADTSAAPTVPNSLPGWTERLKDSKNRPADLVFMFRTLYPQAVDVPDFGYIGKVANKVGGAGRLAELLWQHSAKPPSGDVLAYIQAQAKAPARRNGNDPDAQSEAYHRRMKALLGDDSGN